MSLASKLELSQVTKDNAQQVRKLNLSILPVRYSDKSVTDCSQEAHNDLQLLLRTDRSTEIR